MGQGVIKRGFHGRAAVVMMALWGLAACGHPIDKIPRLSDVPLAADAPQADAMAAPTEGDAQDENEGLFTRLFRKNAPASADTPPSLPTDPAQNAADAAQPDAAPLDRLGSDPQDSGDTQDTTTAPAKVTEQAPPPRKRGLLGMLGFGGKTAPTSAAAPAQAAMPDRPAPDAIALTADALPVSASAPRESTAKPTRRGILSFLRSGTASEAGHDGPVPPPDDAADAPGEAVALAALPDPDPAPQADLESQKPRGLFGLLSGVKSPPRRTGPDAMLVSYGTQLPYGEIAHLCNLPRSAMGTEVASYPERRAKYRLYDSLPGHTGAHTFYITGFNDGCARQFTAALAVFGRASMYERLQYLLPVKQRPNGAADQAYEKVKSKTCGVARGAACGKKMDVLERDTVFLSLYERYGDNARWSNVLLHDGAVIAKDMKIP
ncbi:hypothetical protein DI396_14580 [Litorivita pollutaquae]|uniref:Uncharacterized protein n=1 Tax=Litorivita pollutaquae TaxID=2200892 RepID=A0A2V4N917_9RHOB|nr:hypothetical protein [Litorivita pollutaquae]PYC46533.1 hypothetical protein DI396_14580 [Litorivita pollutaquae]